MKTSILFISSGLVLPGCSVGIVLNDALENFALYARDGHVVPCRKFSPTEKCQAGVFIPGSSAVHEYFEGNVLVLPNCTKMYGVKTNKSIGNS